MKLETILRTSFIVGVIAFFFMLILLLITHKESTEIIFIKDIAKGVCSLAMLVFVVAVIYEVSTSKRINFSEKIMWIVGCIFLSLITGALYIFMGRKRVVTHS